MKIRRISAVCSARVALAIVPSILHAQPATDTLLVREDRVGNVVVGMSIDSLYQTVDRSRTRLVDRLWEGLFDPVIEIRLRGSAGPPTMVAEVTMSRCGLVVGRVWVYDPQLRTASGLHVGSSLAEVRQRHRVVVSREEGLHAIATDPQMTFDLAGDQPASKVTAIVVRKSVEPVVCSSRD